MAILLRISLVQDYSVIQSLQCTKFDKEKSIVTTSPEGKLKLLMKEVGEAK
jgi:hypothetical protein